MELQVGDVGVLIIKEGKAIFEFEPEFLPHGAESFHDDEDVEFCCEPEQHENAMSRNPPQVVLSHHFAPEEIMDRSRGLPSMKKALGELEMNKKRPQTSSRSRKTKGRCTVKSLKKEQNQVGREGIEWIPQLRGEPLEVTEQDYAQYDEYLDRLYEEYREEQGGDAMGRKDFILHYKIETRPNTAQSTASTEISYLDNNGCLTPGGKQRMKRWVKHEEIFDAMQWRREAIDRNAVIKTPAPRGNSRMTPGPSARGPCLVLLDEQEKVAQRPRTAAIATRRPHCEYL